jgi:OmpA-OmpF porin, OOP family
MYQPGKWVWGVVPLGLLWFSANQFFKVDAVNSDLTAKAVAAANGVANAVPGLKTIGIDVKGRDVVLSGETLDAASAAKARTIVDQEFGVRLVSGGLTVATAQKPYTWAATREGSKITLSGFVPDEAVKKANADAAAKAFPGATVDDQQKIAFGAPLGFATMSSSAVPELARLSQGRFSIDDTKFCVEGAASTPENYIDITGKMKAMPQTAFALANCALKPPTIAPYAWGAEKIGPAAISLTGLVPSDEVRKQINDSAKAAFPTATITDLMKPALGAPAGLAALAASGFGDLSRLITGKIALAGTTLTVAGQGPADYASCNALKANAAVKAVTGVSASTDGIICPPAPPPVAVVPPPVPVPVVTAPPVAPPVPAELRAVKNGAEVVVSGLAPSDAAKADLMLAARAAAPNRNARDATVTVRSNLQTPPDYKAITELGLGALGRLDAGEMAIAGPELSVTGSTASPDTKSAVEATLRGQFPQGARAGKIDVAVRPYVLELQSDKSGAVLSGYLPDNAMKTEILSILESGSLKGRIRDDLRIVPGAPANFAVAAKTAVQSVMRLDMGMARLSDQTVSIQGMTCRDLIKGEVENSTRIEQPQGFAGRADISLRQTGCLIDAPNTCQADLDALTRRNAILFQQGKADLVTGVATDAAIGDLAAILRKCPTASIRIEGHTNRDGERYGYNNQALSESRAGVVLAELVKRGIAASRLSSAGYGSRNPLLPNNSDEGREKNRRVQFTVAKP